MNNILNKYIDEMKEQIIHSTCELINIPSIFTNDGGSTAPFGINTAKALEYILNLGKEMGFRTQNIDNQCGYIEFGEGKKLLGIIGHLDVVPADDTWTFPPFNATVSNNAIYGRGAIDDKGPVIATLYAMKAVSEHYSLDKRVRLILGLNEENDWKCIERYKKTEEIPTVSFSPDGNFPCIYSEKTIETVYLKQKYLPNPTLYIESISTHHNAINVVPKFCEITIGFDNSIINNIVSTIQKLVDTYSYSISIEELNASHIKLISTGKAAHAAHPELGENAISKLIMILHDLFEFYHISLDILDYFAQYIGNDYTGKNLGINFQDESGILTLNTAQFSLENNWLDIGFNLRIPVTMDYNNIEKQFKQYCNQNLIIDIAKIQEPLYISKYHKLVQQLCNIFNDYNHSHLEPEAIGGATYARAFPNCISFGPKMPNEKDMCHQNDEYISIENLMFCAKTYAEAILAL